MERHWKISLYIIGHANLRVHLLTQIDLPWSVAQGLLHTAYRLFKALPLQIFCCRLQDCHNFFMIIRDVSTKAAVAIIKPTIKDHHQASLSTMAEKSTITAPRAAHSRIVYIYQNLMKKWGKSSLGIFGK